MSLADAPLILVLLGLVAYMVLAGADFGTGVWELTAPRDSGGAALRDYAHGAMGPVWEANHVWMIFILVVLWSAYPVAFASIFSTLAIPFFIAIVGIILRGSAYVLRAAAVDRERRPIENLFALSSILAPFALGAAIGGIASGRVPVGNAAGNLWTSWLNPTSLVIGIIAVAAAAHLAAVYLAADTTRARLPDLARAFRIRAIVSSVTAGALAIAGLIVVRIDAPHLFEGLSRGPGLATVLISAAAGIATLMLILIDRYEAARYAGALAVAAIIAGWAAAQGPNILPGLSIQAAAAGRTTLITVLVVVAIGAIILIPSLTLLFGLYLRGRFDPTRLVQEAAVSPHKAGSLPRGIPATLVGLLLVGSGLTVFADAGWAQGLGVAALLIFVAGGFIALATSIADETKTE